MKTHPRRLPIKTHPGSYLDHFIWALRKSRCITSPQTSALYLCNRFIVNRHYKDHY